MRSKSTPIATPLPGGWRKARVAGHFGELIQGRVAGQVAVLTLPCAALGVTAHWQPSGIGLTVYQPQNLLSAMQLRGVFRAVGHAVPFGRLRILADMPAGAGAGASTAALLAVARVLGGLQDEAATCLAFEGASDPLMLPQPGQALWASRQVRSLQDLPPLPAMEVLGGYVGPGQRTDPADQNFAQVEDLVAAWAGGDGSAELLGRLATISARRNVDLRGGDLSAVEQAAAALGALGICIAHTGSAWGLLFAKGAAPARVELPGLRSCVRFRVGGT